METAPGTSGETREGCGHGRDNPGSAGGIPPAGPPGTHARIFRPHTKVTLRDQRCRPHEPDPRRGPGPRPAARRHLLRRAARPHRGPGDVRLGHHGVVSPAPSPAAARSSTWSPRRSTRSRSTAGRSTRRRRTTGRGSPSPTSPPTTSCACARDCRYMHTGEGLHRFVDPVDKSRLPLHAVRGRRRPPDVHRLRPARPQGHLHLHRDRAGRLAGRLQLSRPRSRSRSASGTRPGASPRPSGCRRTSPPWSPGRTTGSTASYRNGDRVIPLGALLPRVARGPPRRRRHLRGDQAGLRVLRAGLRPAVPVRQVRPALRAGVQRGRDGERRRASRTTRTTSSARRCRRRPTSAAP